MMKFQSCLLRFSKRILCSTDMTTSIGHKVFICVLVVGSRIFVSSCGVRKFVVGLLWLCMHIINVNDGSTYW